MMGGSKRAHNSNNSVKDQFPLDPPDSGEARHQLAIVGHWWVDSS